MFWQQCRGPRLEEKPCKLKECPILWTNWSEWSSCSVNFGPEIKRRERLCIGNKCEGSTTDEKFCEKGKLELLLNYSPTNKYKSIFKGWVENDCGYRIQEDEVG